MSALQSEIDFFVNPPAITTSVRVHVCPTWTELEQFGQDWNTLLQGRSGASIFQTPEWLGTWWQAYGTQKSLQALVFINAQGTTVGIAPLYQEKDQFLGAPIKSLRMVGAGSGDSDDLDFITAPGYEQICAASFLTWVMEESDCDICALETLPQASLVAHSVADAIQKAGAQLYPETTPNFFIDLPPTWREYLDRLESSFRPLLTRYPRRLQSRYRIRVVRCAREQDLNANLQTLFALHQMRWTGQGEPGAFSSSARRDFYLRMAQSFLKRGWLEFWLLTLDDETVAAQFCFRFGNTVYLLQEGFHPRYAAEKIGYALRAHVLQEMIRTGATRYDFLGGADAYKMKYASRQGMYLTLRFARSWRGRMYLAIHDRKLKLKQWLKNHLPASILALLRHEKSQAAANSLNNQATE